MLVTLVSVRSTADINEDLSLRLRSSLMSAVDLTVGLVASSSSL